MKKRFLGETRKIRSVSLDTNVVIDVLALKFLSLKSRLTSEEKSYQDRCSTSFGLMSLLLSVNVRTVGTDVVRKELSVQPNLRELYSKVFGETVWTSNREKNLAEAYRKMAGIKPADALILALVSGRADCFLSWNRVDIVKPSTLGAVSKINKERNLKTPLVLTPAEFMEKITLTEGRSICFYPGVVPRQFRPRFYPSRQLL